MTHIRPVEEADLPLLLEMIHALAAHHGDVAATTLDHLRRDVLGPHPWVQVLLAPDMGYAALTPLVQLQYGVRGMDLHHLFVLPEVRARGVGRALVAAALEHAKAGGCRYLVVGTHPENRAAQAMYAALGFEALAGAGPRFRVKW